MEPVFSYIYNVRIDKFRKMDLADVQNPSYESDTEVITVLADDLLEAYAKAVEYAEAMPSVWDLFEIVDAERGEQVFIYMDEDEADDLDDDPNAGQPDSNFIAD